MLQRSVGRALSPGEFFAALPQALAGRLPQRLRDFDSRRGPGRLIKIHYGHAETHYEAWHHTRTGRLEVGLHCEAPPAVSRRALGFLARRLMQIKGSLQLAELEPWDRGWCRLYEALPAAQLSDGLVAEAASRLAAYVLTLQPMLEEFWITEEATALDAQVSG